MNYLAPNLKILREQRKLTQAQMAAQLGFPRTTWATYEKGGSVPALDEILGIANYFGLSMDEIIITDLSKGKDSEKSKDEKKSNKGQDLGKDEGKDSGNLPAFTVSETGQKEALNDSQKTFYEALTNSLTLNSQAVLEALQSANSLKDEVQEQKALLKAEIDMRAGLQQLTLEYLSALTNKGFPALYKELGSKVAYAAGLTPTKGRKDHKKDIVHT